MYEANWLQPMWPIYHPKLCFVSPRLTKTLFDIKLTLLFHIDFKRYTNITNFLWLT